MIGRLLNGESERNSHGTMNVLGAFVAGAVTGSIASLLLAPSSGRRTRRALRREGKRMKHRALEAGERGMDILGRASDAASETVKEIKETLPLTRR